MMMEAYYSCCLPHGEHPSTCARFKKSRVSTAVEVESSEQLGIHRGLFQRRSLVLSVYGFNTGTWRYLTIQKYLPLDFWSPFNVALWDH
jgi:hypothetical protein